LRGLRQKDYPDKIFRFRRLALTGVIDDGVVANNPRRFPGKERPEGP